MIKIIENFIEESDAAFFINYMQENKEDKTKFPLTIGEVKGKFRKEANIPELVELQKHEEAIPAIKKVCSKAIKEFISISGEKNLCVSSFWMAMLGPNTRIPEHKDNIEFAEHLYMSAIIYLNEDFDGGSIFFKEENLEYKPKKYSAVFFSSSEYHEVKNINSGVRMTLPIWASKEMHRDIFAENPFKPDPSKTAGLSKNDPALLELLKKKND